MNSFEKLKPLFVYGLIVFFSLISIPYLHEEIHSLIYEDYNINSKIKMFPNPQVIPESNCPTPTCTLAQEINEVVGYQLIPIYFLIAGGFFVIIFVLIRGKNEKH